MVSTGVLCDDTDVKAKAGPNISSDIDSGDTAETDFWIDCAEGQLSTAARYDFVTNIASISAIGKDILKDAASSYAAVLAINYDTDGFRSGQSAIFAVNVLWAGFQKVLDKLEKDEKYRDFILTGVSGGND